MNATKFCSLLMLALITCTQVNAQMKLPFSHTITDNRYTEFTAVCFNGIPLAQANTPEGVLRLNPEQSGKLTVQTVNKKNNKAISAVGFMVAIKDHATNTVWLMSDKVMYEVDLQGLLEKCTINESLIFITTDRKHRLPRNEVSFRDNC